MAQTQFKMKCLLCLIFAAILFLVPKTYTYAESSYVLPYPSAMPGSRFYGSYLLLEKILQYWYFGDFGQFKYSLKEGDKYLVEAKTLFEYKQYLLGYNALKKSDFYFKNIQFYLNKATNEGKNIVRNQIILKEAVKKHIEVLIKLKTELPAKFLWSPEKSRPINLDLFEKIEKSISIRRSQL